ncbi:MAG: T9SS type A sorting domain-containing protein [Cyclobacteriaceae bacterium]|nr:T9SS type A sorting domain-containing protein [Cyclobacteriaceae bacterium]
MKKFTLSLWLIFGLVVISLGGYITGSTQVCPSIASIYSVNFQSGGTCEIITWNVKDANGNNVPWEYVRGEYEISVIWPAINGIGSVKAIGMFCCRIKALCFNDKVETLNVKVGPDKVTSISGPNTICNGSPYTFSINPIPTATSYTWVLPSGWLINGQAETITTTTPFVSIQNGSGIGYAPLTVTANSCNGTISSAPTTRYIHVGVYSDFSINGPSCFSNYNYLSFYPYVSGSYEWIVTLGSNPPIIYNTESISIFSDIPTRIDARLRINTGCGWSDWKSFFAYPCNGGGGSFELLQVYPNSASNEVTVEVPNNLEINLVSLRNFNGHLVNTIGIPENTKFFKLNVSEYNEGIYFLNFQTKNGIIAKRLTIKK